MKSLVWQTPTICQRCGAEFQKKSPTGKFCPTCQPLRCNERSAERKKRNRARIVDDNQSRSYTPRFSRSSFEVVASPIVNGYDDWPHGSHLSRLEIDNCLRCGYFPPGLQFRKWSGEIYQVEGRELREQKLIKI